MKIIVKKQLPKSLLEIEIDEKNGKEAIAQALFFAQPDYCGLCKGQNIIWDYNKATTDEGTFTYIKRKCLTCKATSTAGEYKTGGYYWKAWEQYVPRNPQAPITGGANTELDKALDEIPFG